MLEEPTKPEDKKEEIIPGTPSPDDTFVYKRDSIKTIRQIAKESQARQRKQYLEDLEKKEAEENKEPEEPKEKPDEQPKEPPKEEPKAPETPQPETVTKDEAKKLAEDAVTKATEETRKEFQAKIDEILNKDKTLQEKQKETDELIAAWDKEERLPKDYKEVIDETMRIADAKMERRLKEIEDQKLAREREEQETKKKAEDDAKAMEQKKFDDYNKQIATDLDEIITAGHLPRPKDINEINNENTQDEAAKEIQKVFKFGIDLNTKLKSEGKPPVTSLSKIYFLHYKPFVDAQPNNKGNEVPGGDAPVAGAEKNAPETPTTKVNYQQLHNETWAQTMSRLKREAQARLRFKK